MAEYKCACCGVVIPLNDDLAVGTIITFTSVSTYRAKWVYEKTPWGWRLDGSAGEANSWDSIRNALDNVTLYKHTIVEPELPQKEIDAAIASIVSTTNR